MTMPASRADAKRLGSPLYFTGVPCVRGHVAPRYTSYGICKECGRQNAMARYTHSTTKRRAYSDLSTFIVKAQEVHGTRYSYADAHYTDAHTKLAISCALHGVFLQTPTNHVQGKGCPVCKAHAFGLRSRSSLDLFVKKAEAVWGTCWDYSGTVYTGARALLDIGCRLHGTFKQTQSNHLEGKIGCPRCNHMKSRGEDAVFAFVSLWANTQRRDRSVLKPKELDIHIPEHQLAIEYCGDYWHSLGSLEEVKAKKYAHQQKYLDCKAQGIRLITLYESEWVAHNYAIRRLLRNALGKTKGRLMARKCCIGRPSHSEAQAFYNRYHPQGGDGHGEHYGLYWNSKLVACMRFSFGVNDRGDSHARVWTLSRFATRVTVAGGASRLFKAFLQEHQPQEVKSFSDNRFFDGKMYAQLGFVLDAEVPCDYQVWSPKLGLLPKAHYQRRLLPRRLKEHGVDAAFDPASDPRTEADMTFTINCRRLYDCGKKRWAYRA